jgi:hypothetical protein
MEICSYRLPQHKGESRNNLHDKLANLLLNRLYIECISTSGATPRSHQSLVQVIFGTYFYQ